MCSFLNADLFLKKADGSEISELEGRMLELYSEHLLQPGFFDNEADVKNAADLEYIQEKQQDDTEFFYYHITPENSYPRYGFLIFSIENKTTAYLTAIYLEKDYRGCGLGEESIRCFEALLKNKDVWTVELYVFAHNLYAKKLYEKLGYTVQKAYYSKNGTLLGQQMSKTLRH